MVLLPAGAAISELDGPSNKNELHNMLPTKLFQTMHAHQLEQLVGELAGYILLWKLSEGPSRDR
jgi:hypothetical protein